jgi:hypothetical protein
MNKAISIISLILSILATAIALWRHVDHERAAKQALREREANLIRHFSPNLQKIAADFDVTNYPTNPQTLEEAFDPILQVIEGISGTD